MQAVDLAYMAGIVDGEGCIAIERFRNQPSRNPPSYCYRLKIRIGNTNQGLIEYLRLSLGGSVKTVKPRTERDKEAWEWYTAGEPAVEYIKLLLPYLRIKRPQAELGIKFQSRKRGRGYHLTGNQRALEEADWLLAKSLNKRGV